MNNKLFGRSTSGRNLRSGFTLIELLVVVLIIGILSAIALPQYQKAVQRSRLARMRPMVASLKAAANAYYLANGNYPSDLSALDIEIPSSIGFVLSGGFVGWVGYQEAATKNIGVVTSLKEDIWLCCGSAISDSNKVKEDCGALGYKEYVPSTTGALHGCYKMD